ncbi:hypothetical protein SAMN05428964_10546 [Thalassospira xiamenensis]|uniref:Uncharacterized protein n=1 Tax=Thalassospira xiamenensis TaxID=220697 RepID=A0A285TR81_9PROT|nr:hypothetical protein SAMN05428964_10546 [Thalassospira xiamenensis]
MILARVYAVMFLLITVGITLLFLLAPEQH